MPALRGDDRVAANAAIAIDGRAGIQAGANGALIRRRKDSNGLTLETGDAFLIRKGGDGRSN